MRVLYYRYGAGLHGFGIDVLNDVRSLLWLAFALGERREEDDRVIYGFGESLIDTTHVLFYTHPIVVRLVE